MALATGAAVWAVATRITQLDPNGYVISGSNSYTTNQLIKATITPVNTTGDAIEIKNAAGDLAVWALHGDMMKWKTVALDMALPDPQLEAACAGGTLLGSTAAALGLTTGLTVTGQTTLGSLAASTYGYRATQYNSFGESVAEAEVTVTNTGTTSTNVLSGVTPAAGALGVGCYGRTIGGEALLGYMPVIGSQATSASSGTGAVATLSVTALTAPIPAGFTFIIAGDTNSPKIVWTTLAEAGVGATSLSVSPSQSVTTTIVAAAIAPVFVDTGAITPTSRSPLTDLTAGPGASIGYGQSAPGPVGNPNGVSIEFFEKRIINGYQAADYPYWHYVMPRVANFIIGARDITNAALQTMLTGQAFLNPNWSSGPAGDWPFASTFIDARTPCGAQIVPVAGVTPIAASF